VENHSKNIPTKYKSSFNWKNKVEEDHVKGTQTPISTDNDASHDPSGKVSKKGTLSIFYCKDTDKNPF